MTAREIIPINTIERKPGSEKYRIVGKGVTVEFLVGFINQPDWPVAHICQEFTLTPAEVHAAWAFYYDHQAEIDRRIQEEHDQFDSLAEEIVAKREELKRRYFERTGTEWTPPSDETR